MEPSKEAVEAIRKRQGFSEGSHTWEGIRPTVEANLQAALPIERKRWEEEDLAPVQAKIRELHKALSEGYGVEDGGIWEDRALAAEKALEEVRERLLSESAAEAICDREGSDYPHSEHRVIRANGLIRAAFDDAFPKP